jgi:hypothetical protein
MNVYTPSLLEPGAGLREASANWLYSWQADKDAIALYERHYSCHHYRDGRQRKNFVGPGEKIVLLGNGFAALFVWRKFMRPSPDGQIGVNCSVFRNESAQRSSALILEAMEIAWRRWPGERLFTYVDPKQIRSSNPGYCFLAAGWRRCGVTKWNRLLILEALP